MNRYGVAWGHSSVVPYSHGEWHTDKELVQAWVTEGNVRFPRIHHYLEEEKVSTSSNI